MPTDQKLTELTESTNPLGGDLFYLTTDPSGTPLDQYAKKDTVIRPGRIPGGRLTLTSGTPLTTADVSGATTVYYTPFYHNIIDLWDGNYWAPTVFTEKSLALGTVTSGLPYDVFGYLSAGALTLEKLAWTNTTTRATGISLQDGRLCKTGDKTRLYLGTFYTTSTTQTEDSVTKRFLWNYYNRANKRMNKADATSHTYSTGSYRQWNNDAANKVEFVVGVAEDSVPAFCQSDMSGATGGISGLASNTTGNIHAKALSTVAEANLFGLVVYAATTFAAGYNYIALNEFGAASVTFASATLWADWKC